jgi:uncharacterized protein (DUF58 family)
VRRVQGPPARAVALAAAGAAALVASRGFGTPALATLGVGLVALPVLVTALVWAAAGGLRVHRRISPARCRAGDEVEVRLALSGWPAQVGLDRLLDVSLDPGLGAAGDAGDVRREGLWVWRLPRAARGDHQLPPPVAHVGDPFGLARRSRAGAEGESLLVVPRAPRLERLALEASTPGGGLRRRRMVAGFGELERVRDYRAGDPLSRVHWAQTAKRGRLQTKELRASEGPGKAVMLLLDAAGAGGEDFETAVTATAALARHLAERGERLALVHTGDLPMRLAAGRATWPAVEIALARVSPGGRPELALALRAESAAPEVPELIVVVTSDPGSSLSSAVAGARAAGIAVAVVLTGRAAVAAPDLERAGAGVTIVPQAADVAAALAADRERAGAA